MFMQAKWNIWIVSSQVHKPWKIKWHATQFTPRSLQFPTVLETLRARLQSALDWLLKIQNKHVIQKSLLTCFVMCVLLQRQSHFSFSFQRTLHAEVRATFFVLQVASLNKLMTHNPKTLEQSNKEKTKNLRFSFPAQIYVKWATLSAHHNMLMKQTAVTCVWNTSSRSLYPTLGWRSC